MLKLYFPPQAPTKYWENWDNDDGTFTVHWGELGTTGESKIVTGSFLKPARKNVSKEENSYRSKGYDEIDYLEHSILLVEYGVDGFGTPDDLSKRHSLEDLMNETLGWTGLGRCDGGSIGNGTMEVCCFVVDFEIAKQVVSEALEGTKYSDYSRIFQER